MVNATCHKQINPSTMKKTKHHFDLSIEKYEWKSFTYIMGHRSPHLFIHPEPSILSTYSQETLTRIKDHGRDEWCKDHITFHHILILPFSFLNRYYGLDLANNELFTSRKSVKHPSWVHHIQTDVTNTHINMHVYHHHP